MLPSRKGRIKYEMLNAARNRGVGERKYTSDSLDIAPLSSESVVHEAVPLPSGKSIELFPPPPPLEEDDCAGAALELELLELDVTAEEAAAAAEEAEAYADV